MRYQELLESKTLGTFMGIYPTDECSEKISDWCMSNKIDNVHDEFHTTIIIDKVKPFAEAPERYDPPLKIKAKDCNFDLFGPEKNILVVTYSEPILTKRHNKIKEENNIEYDFPEYIPHITLSYGFDGKIEELPTWTIDLELSEEYTKPFDSDWSPKPLKEEGLIVPGVNTTIDVKVGEIQRQSAKFGNKLDKDGNPPSMWDSAKLAVSKTK